MYTLKKERMFDSVQKHIIFLLVVQKVSVPTSFLKAIRPLPPLEKGRILTYDDKLSHIVNFTTHSTSLCSYFWKMLIFKMNHRGRYAEDKKYSYTHSINLLIYYRRNGIDGHETL